MPRIAKKFPILDLQPDAGYSPDGLSIYSHRAGQGRIGLTDFQDHNPPPHDASKVDLLIRRHMHELRKLERKIAAESNPKIAGKLAAQHEIKMRFIAKLRREQITATDEAIK